MLNRQHRRAKVLFGVSDVILTTLAFQLAYHIRLALPLEREFALDTTQRALVLGFSVLAWVLAGRWLRVYDQLDSGSPRVILRDTLKQCLSGAGGLICVEYLLRLDLSRSFVALFAAGSWILLCLFRLTAGNVIGLIRREFAAPHYVMIVGTGDQALRIGAELERSAAYGVRLLGFLTTLDNGPREITLGAAYPVHPIGDLRQILRRQVIDDIVFAVTSNKLAELEEVFLLCDEEGVRTRLALDFFPHVNSKVSLEQLGVTPLLTFAAAPNDEIRLLLKRLMDVLLAGAGLVVLLPFMVAIMLLVRVTSRGPAIFIQERCGLNGRRFRFYKFRSMCENAEELKPQLEHLNRKSTAFKIPDDPRLTSIGRWLRKFSIDEWPQLWNVLRGDMSMVGPRPAVPEEVERYQQWQRRRLRMRPGLTCLWAVAGRDRLDFESWMKLDMDYIDNWSLGLDWKILLLTIPRVLTGSGAS